MQPGVPEEAPVLAFGIDEPPRQTMGFFGN
jgi:hypothetical protein